ncbi:MAG: undecaprenyldiphospho-muramoylpentapeptide beta-N-acetylglucosaminyltransferase [Pseudomonadota bacterium]
MSRILVMAGGTGGHIFPALAVAKKLRGLGCEVRWLGSQGGMEQRLVDKAGFEGDWISVAGVRGKGWRTKLLAPFRLVASVWQALRVLRLRRPDAVLGMGGFASGPGGLAAWLTRRPLIIHEQNAVAGTTNKVLSRLADKVFTAFPHAFGTRAQAVVGNPVRDDIIALPVPEQRFAKREGALRVLVLGGSQGALALNEYVPRELAEWAKTQPISVLHQSGERTFSTAQDAYEGARLTVNVVPFITDMAQAYGWADLAVCRAGALTISELAAAGLAAVLVPFPFAIDDHQTLNAAYLEQVGAGRILAERDCQPGALVAMLKEVADDRGRLLAMATAARHQRQPDSANVVAVSCVELASGVAL